ncbi:MAG TPA: hypothetical protein VFE60_23765 [Roseiarcus sp.]|nr:hypothetical protein [Roseiarcus sp.]
MWADGRLARLTSKKRGRDNALVLGVDAPGAGHDKLHDLMVTQDFYDALPPIVRDHLACRVVEQLIPVTQKHDIEGLVMGVA